MCNKQLILGRLGKMHLNLSSKVSIYVYALHFILNKSYITHTHVYKKYINAIIEKSIIEMENYVVCACLYIINVSVNVS